MNQAVEPASDAGISGIEPGILTRARPARLLAVLGMHRSGTSCLTGSLQAAGLFLGNCHTWNPYNLKGNRENQAFVDLHDTILADNGGSWDSPPRRVRWKPEHRELASELLAGHGTVEMLGFKDPRALLLVDGWQSIFPNLEMVGIFRHPEAVARSLYKRSEFPREQALELWYQYNRVLLGLYRKHRFPILCFDEEATLFQERVVALARWLRLPQQPNASDFYEDTLRQCDGGQRPDLPWRIRWLYWQLRRASRRGPLC